MGHKWSNVGFPFGDGIRQSSIPVYLGWEDEGGLANWIFRYFPGIDWRLGCWFCSCWRDNCSGLVEEGAVATIFVLKYDKILEFFIDKDDTSFEDKKKKKVPL